MSRPLPFWVSGCPSCSHQRSCNCRKDDCCGTYRHYGASEQIQSGNLPPLGVHITFSWKYPLEPHYDLTRAASGHINAFLTVPIDILRFTVHQEDTDA